MFILVMIKTDIWFVFINHKLNLIMYIIEHLSIKHASLIMSKFTPHTISGIYNCHKISTISRVTPQ